MNTTILSKRLFRDLKHIDKEDIFSEWQWQLQDDYELLLVSSVGDMFLKDPKGKVVMLDTVSGTIKKLTGTKKEFENLIKTKKAREELFSESLIEELIAEGKKLSETEVYSFNILPILGGDFTVGNIEPTDISVHFSITGQIHRQLQDLPDGTTLEKIKFKS